MKYRYNLYTGLAPIKTNLKKYAVGAVSTLAVVAGVTAPSFAAAPASPGCFGRDRAAYATENGSLGSQPGGVGYYASLRAGDNGAMNQAYKSSCGGDPTQ